MNKDAATQVATATFEDEATHILADIERVRRVEHDGAGTWTLHLFCVDEDDAQTARLKIIDDLTDTLSEEACEGLAFKSEVLYGGKDSSIVLEILDDDEDTE